MHYTDIAIFVLEHFILTHVVYTECGKKYLLELFVIFLAIAGNFEAKLYRFITRL